VTPLYPQKLALTSPTGGGRSVGIVRSGTKATEKKKKEKLFKHTIRGSFQCRYKCCKLVLLIKHIGFITSGQTLMFESLRYIGNGL